MKYLLTQSPVVFNEEHHRYQLGDKRLLGITGLIHEVLGLGVYADASDFVKNVAIPRAGEYGSSVHKAIEMFDEIGIKQTTYPNSFCDEPWDVSSELENYIRHQVGFIPLANEHTVSDNDKWATNIDNVWQREQTGGIWLVDTKTNNLNTYPLDGYGVPNYFNSHVDALKEYLSWQLSINAELFEAQNPGLKVEGLACNWLRKEDSAFWIIERKPSALVQLLLLATYEFDEDGVAHYSHPNTDALFTTLSIPKTQEVVVAPDVIAYVSTLLKMSEEAEQKLKQAKQAIHEAMKKHNVKSFDCGLFRATIVAESISTSFDTARFKEEHPDLYKEYYTKKTTKKESFTLKNKDK